MHVDLYEMAPCPRGRLATMARPRGGYWLRDEVASLKEQGVTDVVSLLTWEEELDLDLQAEEQECLVTGLRFHRLPIADRGLPEQEELARLVNALVPVLDGEGFVAIHCRAGIGRSSLVAAALLVRLGMSGAEALRVISRARGFAVPDTEEQRDFILGLT